MVPVNLKKLTRLYTKMYKRVRYKLGAKAPRIDCDPSEIKRIDCSGFVRYLIYNATGGKLVLPDGSWKQREWCRENKLHELLYYADVSYAKSDNRLFICFIRPRFLRTGHVWLVIRGVTLESHSRAGVNSRPWNTKSLRKCDAAYELPVV